MFRLSLEIFCNVLGSKVVLGCVLSTGIWHSTVFCSAEYQLLKIFVVKKALFFLLQPYKKKYFWLNFDGFTAVKCSLQSYKSYFKISYIQLLRGGCF